MALGQAQAAPSSGGRPLVHISTAFVGVVRDPQPWRVFTRASAAQSGYLLVDKRWQRTESIDARRVYRVIRHTRRHAAPLGGASDAIHQLIAISRWHGASSLTRDLTDQMSREHRNDGASPLCWDEFGSSRSRPIGVLLSVHVVIHLPAPFAFRDAQAHAPASANEYAHETGHLAPQARES